MNYRLKKKEHKAMLSLLMACLYFTIAVCHIFHLPCLTTTQPVKTVISHNSLFKRKTENLNNTTDCVGLLQRTYKSVTNDKRSVTDFLKGFSACVILLFCVLPVWKLRKSLWITLLDHRDDSPQPVYLTIRSLRI
ncbi:hypothetical protein C8P68_10696 [Mucilaginibacter yixingensis]|uniref:Uncharacterized protein n=1 Tax=Mucilaginibacter yixingensis TaxID=1295612 RepID=A0A2T5J741_9SPHI|nr:hypothetical protein [Mucilaginibacter yixingensis]PTQ94886.1 hypothetical protein C8P68_10696 [Mucilaginibacter yixingensis]